ncbi:MAG: hypothetical protein AB1603_07360, partial [Chloroflexota bacterium]
MRVETMRFKRRSGNWLRRLVVGLAVALALCLVALPVFAAHTATVTNIPTSADPNTSTSFTLTVTNDAGSADRIKQVDLVVDSSWSSVAAGTPPTNWSANVVGNTITWTATKVNARITAGSSKDFPWSATTGAAETSSHQWTTTDDGTPTPGTDTGTVTTVVGAADFYPLAALGLLVLIYL